MRWKGALRGSFSGINKNVHHFLCGLYETYPCPANTANMEVPLCGEGLLFGVLLKLQQSSSWREIINNNNRTQSLWALDSWFRVKHRKEYILFKAFVFFHRCCSSLFSALAQESGTWCHLDPSVNCWSGCGKKGVKSGRRRERDKGCLVPGACLWYARRMAST